MKNDPLVSVVMPVFNKEMFVGQAIQSVLNQTYQNIELIIIDDKSTDSSLEICKRFKAENPTFAISIIEKSFNSGVAESRNIGIDASKGEYIALLDADDLWTEDKIEKQIKLITETNADLVYCSYDLIDIDGKQIGKPFIVPKETDFNKMLTSSVISCSTALVKSSIIKNFGFSNEYYHEDYLLWMQMLFNNAIALGDTDILACYRQIKGSKASSKANSAKHRWTIYRKALGLSVARSIFSFIGYTYNGVKKYL